jgi:hypothetical protein
VAAPVAATQLMAPYPGAGGTAVASRATAPVPARPAAPAPKAMAARRRPSRARRFFVALFALVLLLAVPVVSAYVSYKLASGENPFEWPPTMDLSRVF